MKALETLNNIVKEVDKILAENESLKRQLKPLRYWCCIYNMCIRESLTAEAFFNKIGKEMDEMFQQECEVVDRSDPSLAFGSDGFFGLSNNGSVKQIVTVQQLIDALNTIKECRQINTNTFIK